MSRNSRYQQKSVFRSPPSGFQHRSMLYSNKDAESSSCREPLNLPRPVFPDVPDARSRYRDDEEGGGPRVQETESDSYFEYSQSRDDDETFFTGASSYQELGTPISAPSQMSMAVSTFASFASTSSHDRETQDVTEGREQSGLKCPKEGCNKVFSRKDAVKRHFDTVHRGMKIACSQCSKLFRDKAELNRHAKKIHESQELRCDVAECGKAFSSKDSLAHHKKAKHSQGSLFRCDLAHCQAKFTHKHLLEGHMVTHTGEKAFECPVCNRKFAYRHNLTRHQHNCKGRGKTQRGAGKFMCKVDGCGKGFADKRCLSRHFAASHNKVKYMCEFCKTQFAYMSALSRHKCAAKKN